MLASGARFCYPDPSIRKMFVTCIGIWRSFECERGGGLSRCLLMLEPTVMLPVKRRNLRGIPTPENALNGLFEAILIHDPFSYTSF